MSAEGVCPSQTCNHRTCAKVFAAVLIFVSLLGCPAYAASREEAALKYAAEILGVSKSTQSRRSGVPTIILSQGPLTDWEKGPVKVNVALSGPTDGEPPDHMAGIRDPEGRISIDSVEKAPWGGKVSQQIPNPSPKQVVGTEGQIIPPPAPSVIWSWKYKHYSVFVGAGGPYGTDTQQMLRLVIRVSEAIHRGMVEQGLVDDSAPAVPGDQWLTAVGVGAGGALAVAAAANLILSTFRSKNSKSHSKDKDQDPDEVIGHVLQLSTQRIECVEGRSAQVGVRVFQVFANGQYAAAPKAAISVTPSAGLLVQPQSGVGSLTCVVWPEGASVSGSLQISASAGGGGTEARVEIVGGEQTRLLVGFDPEDRREIVANGIDSVTIKAAVVLSAADTAAGIDTSVVNSSIEFRGGEWLDLSRPIPWGEGVAVRAVASQPDVVHHVKPPTSEAVAVSAKVRDRLLRETIMVGFAPDPEMEVVPQLVRLTSEGRGTVEVLVTIDPGGNGEWAFQSRWAEDSKPVVTVEEKRTGPASETLTLTEDSKGKLDPSRPEQSATLRVLASREGFEDLECYLKVIIVQEGVFVDSLGRNPDGTFHLKADGSGTPVDVDVRVYVRDADGHVKFDPTLSQSLSVEPADDESRNALEYAQADHERAGIRQLNNPAAIHRFHTGRVLPTAGKPLTVRYAFSVEGHDEPGYTALASFSLLGVDMSPFSPAWDVEFDRCTHIINTYIPGEQQSRFRKLLADRGKTMGAEGLYELRRRIWSYAETKLQQEIHEQLDIAWEHEQIEGFLDWVSWCGDIAIGVASGSYVGTVGSIAIGMLKPVLVSAVTCWVNGRSLEDWRREQVSVIVGVGEGLATDVDLLAQLPGESKALAWAIFLSYYFVKELYNDPDKSVVKAMTNVGRMVRDQALTQFLRHVAGVKPPGGHGTEEEPTSQKKPGATEEPAKKPGVGEEPPVKGGQEEPTTKPTAGDEPPAKKPGAQEGTETKPGPKEEPSTKKPEESKPKPDEKPPTKEGESGGKTEEPHKTSASEESKSKPGAAEEPAKPKSDKTDAPTEDAKKPAPEEPKPKENEPANPAGEHPEPNPSDRAKGMASDIESKTSGGKKLDRKTVMDIMTDPDAMRELKRNRPDLWQKLHEARQEIYRSHDKQLKNWIKENCPEAKNHDVIVESFGTKDGVDRDYRAGYVITDPMTGKKRFIELKKETWAPESQKIFAKETGGPTDPQGAAKWAKDHQQLATDQYHAEASVDMADQGTVWNEKTKQWEKAQLTPNVNMVKDGHSTLLDPQGLGHTYETKVNEAYHAGSHLDAYKQADKATHSLEGCREGYKKQGYKLKELPPDVEAGMQAIKDVNDRKITPAEADARLKELRYPGGLPDFIQEISRQFGSFEGAKK